MNGIMEWLRRNWLNAALVLALLAGACLLAYPTASNLWNEWHQSRAISGYNLAVQGLSEQDYTAELEAAREYNASLAGRNDRYAWENAGDMWDIYNGLLDVGGDGIMGYVDIPKIGVKLPVYHGTADNVLQIAAGHLYGSSLPVGGTGTHAVLSGHTGLPRAALFTDLTELETGDTFMLRVLDELLTYQVDQVKTVLPDDTADLQIDPEKDYCTLVTCTPYGVNSHRLLVRGARIENAPEAEEAVRQEPHDAGGPGISAGQIAMIAGPMVFAAAIAAAALHTKRKTKKAR